MLHATNSQTDKQDHTHHPLQQRQPFHLVGVYLTRKPKDGEEPASANTNAHKRHLCGSLWPTAKREENKKKQKINILTVIKKTIISQAALCTSFILPRAGQETRNYATELQK